MSLRIAMFIVAFSALILMAYLLAVFQSIIFQGRPRGGLKPQKEEVKE
jgi:hypothetical protein